MDAADTYRATATRTLEEVLPDADWSQPAHACPGWTVKDLVSHLVGLAEDVVTGNVAEYGSGPWTARQIERRSTEAPTATLLRWRELLDAIAPMLRDPQAAGLPNYLPGLTVADALTHEHDLRQALDRPGARDMAEVGDALEKQLSRVSRLLSQAEQGIAVEFEDGVMSVLGADAAATRPPLTLKTTRFELWRTMMGRRSLAQALALNWSGDASAVASLLVPFASNEPPRPIDWRTVDLVE